MKLFYTASCGGFLLWRDGVEPREPGEVEGPHSLQMRPRKQRRSPIARVRPGGKFQGWKAKVVLGSKTASTPDNLLRHMGLFFSRNCVKVGISRARGLAVV